MTTHTYSTAGLFLVHLRIIDSFGNSDEDTITIYVINPVPQEFSCVVKAEECLINELELMRFYDTRYLEDGIITNTHVRGFDDPEKDSYTLPLCCVASALTPTVNDVDGENVYAVLQTDAGSVEGGSHLADESNTITKYYHLSSNIGAGSSCESTTEECSSVPGDKKCVYEFLYDTANPEGGSHFANCTEEHEPNNYPNKMCCDITEDCTNNVDDDSNMWTDCVDYNVCTVEGEEQVCGVSKVPEYGECSWYDNYKWEYGYDFSEFDEPTLKNVFGNDYPCYGGVVPGYANCDVCVIEGALESARFSNCVVI